LPPPYARTIAREELDQLLLERAAACGAQVFQPATALRLERTPSGIACIARPSLEIEGRAIIAAHGFWEAGSLPTQPRHLAPQGADLLAFKAHFRGCGAAPGTIALVPFPGGYAGVVEIGGGRTTFACCIRRGRLEELRAAGLPAGESTFRYALSMSRGMREAFEGAVREGPWLASGPLRPGARPLYRDGVFAVGNAAGEVHPVIGEGIAIAMSSARALCQPLIAALEEGYTPAAQAALAREYERRWRRIFRRRHWSSACFARLAMRPSAAAWANLALRRTPSLLTLAARLSS
jgi:flavin-dependent dehydrogenase